MQTAAIRLSELREKINEASLNGGLDADELKALQTEAVQLEKRYRDELIAAESRVLGTDPAPDGETAEVRSLRQQVTLGDYLSPAAAGAGITGAAVELNAALGLEPHGQSGGVALPWALLAPEARALETRAFTATAANDGPEAQRPILQRLFGPGVLDTLGVRVDSVPVGRTEWPLITGTAAPDQTKEETAATATAATFAYANLKPKKLTGAYEWTHEAAASVGGLEAALRRDLGDAIKAKMSDVIVNGTAPDTNNPERIKGFLAELTAEDLSSGQAAYADYGKLHSLAVDGIHAEMETEVSSIIGDETYRHAAGVYQAGSGESGTEALTRRSRACRGSTYIPAIASKKQSAILHAAGPNGGAGRGDSVAAMWPAVEVVRDPYSKASQGVVLTWVALWDARVAFRAAAYKLLSVQVQA